LILAAVPLIAVSALACSSSSREEATPEPTFQVAVGTPGAFVTGTPVEEQVQAEPPVADPTLVSLEWLEQPVGVPPLPPIVAPTDDETLRSAVQSAVTGAEGRVSVVVRNLDDGRRAAIAEDEVYYAASTFKLGILYEAFRQRDAGLLDFGKVLTLEPEYAENDLGTLELLDIRAGDRLTVADAVRAMIIVSDTPSAVLLQDTVGGQTADATLRGLGIEDTSFNNRMLPATAADLAVLLEAIAGGSGVSGESRDWMLKLLLQEGYMDGIAAGLPEGTPLAHKTGSYVDATHDVALVWGPGGPYIIAVMTDRPNNWPLIAQVSKAVWDYFAANP
jgi:beta-lactamase class A